MKLAPPPTKKKNLVGLTKQYPWSFEETFALKNESEGKKESRYVNNGSETLINVKPYSTSVKDGAS